MDSGARRAMVWSIGSHRGRHNWSNLVSKQAGDLNNSIFCIIPNNLDRMQKERFPKSNHKKHTIQSVSKMKIDAIFI